MVSNMLENFTEYCSSASLMYCIISGGVSFAVWKYFLGKYDKGELPTLTYQESELSQYLIKNCKELTKPFKPPFYARNRHIQTILPEILPKPKYEYKREYIPMEDGGQVALDWGVTGTEKVKEDSTILVILPGLTGDNNGFKSLCKRAAEQGLRPVFFNKRGHGNSILTTPKLQSFGDVSDFRVCVVYIHKLFPDAKMVAIGHSAGSGLLACYLGTYKDESLISAACCVSPGYDGLKLFSQPLPWPYDFLLLRGLKNLVRQHAHVLSKAVDVKHVLESETIKEFDYRVYCKMYGVKDMDNYWIINNPATKMWGVSVPTLCINSLTDPIFGEGVIPWNLFREKPNAFLATVKGGGHCGFLHGVSAERWNFILGLDFLTSVTEYLLSRKK